MAFNFDSVPFKDRDQWCVYKLETVNGIKTKVPYQISGYRASSTDPRTWTSFSTALNAYENLDGFNGICFMLSEDNGVVFIDLDNCIKDGIIEEWAIEIVNRFASYTEKSQSGKGLHILIKAKKPGKRCRTESYPNDIEIYDHARQCCLTGDILDGHDKVEPRQEELNKLYQEVFSKVDTHKPAGPDTSGTARTWSLTVSDEALILKARLAKNGTKFEALWNGSFQGYPSQSEADQALMNLLAFWTGDASRMESLFSQSGLGQRDKWRHRPSYREDTIYKALHDTTEFHAPPKEPKDKHIPVAMPDAGPEVQLLDMTQIKTNPDKPAVNYWALSEQLVKLLNIKRLPGGLLAVYNQGVYLTADAEYVIDSLVRTYLHNDLNSKLRANLYIHIRAAAPAVTWDDFETHTNLLCCPNGVVDLRTLKTYPHNPDYMMLHRTAVDYKPGAKSTLWDKTLTEIIPAVNVSTNDAGHPVIILPGSMIISPGAVGALVQVQWNPLDQMLKQHAEAHFAGGRGTTICDNKGTVSDFVVRVGEETVTFVVSTAKETMMTTIYLKGEIQSER